ncbi:MAG: hypothetical protein HOV67_35645 [Kribbellaceae bacterium]|nr:hypothetical protein [Kribbellaceae bacterium]
MGFELSRPAPLMDAAAYKTYEMRSPLATHFRAATCAEVNCPHYLNGWRVHLEALPAELADAARKSGRRYREEKVAEGQTYLVFEAGQNCFRVSQHRARIDRPPLYIVRDGDFRGNPRGTKARLHQRAIADEIEKG